jgi:hypothetical protein
MGHLLFSFGKIGSLLRRNNSRERKAPKGIS